MYDDDDDDELYGEEAPVSPKPWFKGPKDTKPFVLSKLIKSNEAQAPPIYTSATFPWSTRSLQALWDGSLQNDPEWIERWFATIEEWTGTIAAGSLGQLFLFPKLASTTPTIFKLLDEKRHIDKTRKVTFCAWALHKDKPTEPLIILATSSVIYIVDARTRKAIGRLRGHGGEIHAIAVHPFHPYIFCTTSRDQTIRVYDLTLGARQKPNNVHWPPDTRPSLAGPAFGLQCSEPEGEGFGRCVAVLVGGRSGGHEGAVLDAAFHPTFNLLATCGMDRAVKIWRIPPLKADGFAREDKPIFSTDMLHKARVLSVSWLSHDILLTHSAPAWMRKPGEAPGKYEYYQESGTIVLWRWLGFDRFFPPGKPDQEIKRGVASDYRRSDSFKILSCYSLPMHTPNIHVYRTITHDPIVVVPLGNTARIFNVTHFKAREPPEFPLSELEVVELTKRMRLSNDDDDDEEEERAEEKRRGKKQSKLPAPILKLPKSLLDSVTGWELPFPKTDAPAEMEIQSCEVACDGRVIVGVGIKGTMVIWKLRQDA